MNADDTNIDYTDEDGVVTQLDLTALVQNLETLTTIVENTDVLLPILMKMVVLQL
ncbi:hypothetical protein [Nonlabens tegetincola]|uniref:hypothetical protein n=1 Tax=Nonlabens tegetincola TaxID=323273 RepID=UPI0015E2A78B|nr:hypothetical protein [Nonlabens tegetincola]